MASPKEIEEKMDRMLNSWQSLAPAKTFGGMTLAQFQAVVQTSKDARQHIDDLEEQVRQAIADRDAADESFNNKAKLVVNGVRADPTEGPDSALYAGFGYTTDSDRKSGLTRKGNKTPTS
jgi:hypothetical protein